MLTKMFDSKWVPFWAFLLGFGLCLFGAGSSIIYILDEAKNSEAAREMLLNSNWFKPTFNNVIRTDKPPLHYFFMMLGYKLFGVNAFGARFFSAVFGGFTFLTTYLFTKRHLKTTVANITLGVLCASFYFIQEFHLAVPDPYLIFWMSLTFFCYIHFYVTQEKIILWCLYVSIGFGTLTKGPVAIVMPALIVFIHLLISKEFSLKALVNLRVFEGLVLVLLISAPWFYLAHIHTNGVFTEGFFLKHNVGRFQNKMEGHGGVFLITIGFVLLGMFPFSIWLFRTLFYGLKQKKTNSFVFFGSLMVLVFVTFFAISATKLPNYTMPCYPMIAVLLGWFFDKVRTGKINVRFAYIEWMFLLLITLLLPVAGYIGLSLEPQLQSKKWIALCISFLPFYVLISWVLFHKGKLKYSFYNSIASFILLSVVLFGIVFPQLTQESPVTMFSKQVAKETPVIVYKRMDSAFPINNNRTYKVVNTLTEVNRFFKENPQGVVLTNVRRKKDLESISTYKELFCQKSLFENHTTRVFINPSK